MTTVLLRLIPTEPDVQHGARSHRDVVVTLALDATVGDVADALAPDQPGRYSLRIDGTARCAERSAFALDGSLVSGAVVALVVPDGATDRAVAGSLQVVAGPDAGKVFTLWSGANIVGRGNDADVQLADPLASRHHARITIDTTATVDDLGSTNGVAIDDSPIEAPSIVLSGQRLSFGDTVAIFDRSPRRARPAATGATIEFNRPPRALADDLRPAVELPLPPAPPSKPRLPLAAALAPLLLGAVMFFVAPKGGFRISSLLFMGMSPVMALGSFFENRSHGRRAQRQAVAAFDKNLGAATATLERRAANEFNERHRQAPRAQTMLNFADRQSERLWERALTDPDALRLRAGIATVASRIDVKVEGSASSDRLPVELAALRDRFATIAEAPAVVPLRDLGVIGITGGEGGLPIARALVAQVVGLHSPTDVVLTAIVGPHESSAWGWLAWLPHTSSPHSPLRGQHLADSPIAADALIGALDAIIERRLADRVTTVHRPAIVLVVSADAPIERARLANLLEASGVGVYVLWLGVTRSTLPAACRVVIDVSADGETADVMARNADTLDIVSRVILEGLEAGHADLLARMLAPVVDTSRPAPTDAALPDRVAMTDIVPTADGSPFDAGYIAARWNLSPASSHLGAPVGVTGDGSPFTIDFRRDGPHGLVAGTTGSGKSELLQTLVTSLAVENSPSRLTFLLVDYKGGSAFGSCVGLPHTVGLVTDLSVTEVRRALMSLNAELHWRERLITERAGAKDLIEMERMGHPDTPPNLLIVVDEFAALSHEVPEFVTGMVNVAQRGRSLGLHLLLATQRPAGVITDAIKANTNLRIALRTADANESQDVVGSSIAAEFSPRTPGRAVARIGSTLTAFQAAYVGGISPRDGGGSATVTVADLGFGRSTPWPPSGAGDPMGSQARGADAATTDLVRLVAAISAAADQSAVARPRRPWLDPLPAIVEAESLGEHGDHDAYEIGLVDLPRTQSRDTLVYRPEHDGSLLVLGTGGTGKTVLLRTLAMRCARASTSANPVFVYALDFGGRGLRSLESLPNVGAVVPGDDHERVTRMLRLLRSTVAERSMRFRQHDADSLSEYRRRTGEAEPRIVVMLDNYAAFHSTYEQLDRGAWSDLLTRLITDGRAVGVHLVITADRRQAVPPPINSAISRRIVLRLAGADDYAMVGIGAGVLTAQSPAGRCVVDDLEAQIAIEGGSGAGDAQADAIRSLAIRLGADPSRATAVRPVSIAALPTSAQLADMPAGSPLRPNVAIGDERLEAVAVDLDGHMLVAGPARSGRTTALVALAAAMQRARSPHSRYLVALRPVVDTSAFDAFGFGRDAGRLVQTIVDAVVADEANEIGELVLFVDDLADLVTEIGAPLNELVRLAKTRPVMIVATGENIPLRRAFDIATQELRSARRGLLLAPDLVVDGDLLGVSLPRLSRPAWPPGRGYLVDRGAMELVQWCDAPAP